MPAARRIYLDGNATTAPAPEVLAAFVAAAEEGWGNPASLHGDGRAARRHVEEGRAAVAALFKVDPRDVLLTASGTEANNLALAALIDGPQPGRLLVSPLEHPSVLATARRRCAHSGRELVLLPVTGEGRVDSDALRRLAAEGPVAGIAVQAVNHETGVLQPLADVLAVARDAGCRVLCDTVQAAGRLGELWLEADYRPFAAHKVRGLKGIGALITRPGAPLRRVLDGGAQERGLRPGTQDGLAGAALAVAARRALAGPARYAELAPLRDALEDGLRPLGARVLGAAAPRAPHVTAAVFPGWESPELVAALDLEGLSVSGGSACSAGTVTVSEGIVAFAGEAAARAVVRFSLHEGSTPGDVDEALARLRAVLARA